MVPGEDDQEVDDVQRRLTDFCITQLWAAGPSRTCIESSPEERKTKLLQNYNTGGAPKHFCDFFLQMFARKTAVRESWGYNPVKDDWSDLTRGCIPRLVEPGKDGWEVDDVQIRLKDVCFMQLAAHVNSRTCIESDQEEYIYIYIYI